MNIKVSRKILKVKVGSDFVMQCFPFKRIHKQLVKCAFSQNFNRHHSFQSIDKCEMTYDDLGLCLRQVKDFCFKLVEIPVCCKFSLIKMSECLRVCKYDDGGTLMMLGHKNLLEERFREVSCKK